MTARHAAAPIERKVAAAGGSSVVAGAVAWALTSFVFDDGLPDQILALINWLVPVLFAVAAGYLARHTSRPDTVVWSGHAPDVPPGDVPPQAPRAE